MLILITNDDGIQAPGIRALWTELSTIADVVVVAPDGERSACSQSITVHHPIRVDEYELNQERITAWSVNGTPADCVKIALEALMPTTPDLVISGINRGANLGTDVLYSGTVSAAIEASLHGLPAIAVSLADFSANDFSLAAQFTCKLAKTLLGQASLPSNTLLNVNVPAIKPAEISGVTITKLGKVYYNNVLEKRFDPRGRMYYWMAGNILDVENDVDSDVTAIKNHNISITPIHFDLTNYAIIDSLKEWDLNN